MNKLFKKTAYCTLALSIVMATSPVYALSKEETVYSKLNSDGSVKSTIASEFLSANGTETISDVTNLKNILNINGEETFKVDGTNITWNNKGNDIYYQGETDKELPVSLNITYELNGKSIALKDLLGKKGNVTIKMKYKNNDAHTVNVNGKYETMYTPFIVTMGTIISNDNNSNISVTNGRVVSNGSKSVVVALASPGLYESLDFKELSDFDTITINYDTTNFELGSMYSVVSSDLISEDDLSIFNKLDGAYSKLNTLSSSSKKLVDGAKELENGAKTLKSGSTKLAQGASSAYLGSKKISDTLTSKINEVENSAAIDDTTLSNIKTLASTQAKSTVESNKATIQTTAKTTVDGLINICGVYESTGTMVQGYEEYTEFCTAYNGLKTAVGSDTYLKALLESVASSTAYNTSLSTAETTAGTTSELVATQVAETAKKGTVESLKTLNEGITSLTNGLNDLNSGVSSLDSGISTLSNGTETLSSGVSKFDEEGIQSIVNLVNGTVKGTEDKVKALVKLGNDYDTFTMKNNDTTGKTKFVLMVDSQTKVEKTKSTTKKETKQTVIDKIKNLFK